MAEFDFGSFTDDAASRAIEPQITEATPAEVLGATADTTFNALPIPRLTKELTRDTTARQAVQQTGGPAVDPRSIGSDADAASAERGEGPDTTPVHQDDANAQAKKAGAELTPFTDPVSQQALQGMIDDQVSKQNAASVIARNGNAILSGKVAQFGVGALVSLADPLNDMAMMIPVAPEAWVAGKLAAAGGAFGRAGVRAAEGAAQGAAGMAALQPLEYAQDAADHQDFEIGEALRNIAFGAVLGGVGHATVGGIIDRMNPETRIAAARATLADVMNDRAVDVAPILEAGEALHPPPAIITPERIMATMDTDTRAAFDQVETKLADPALPDEERAPLEQQRQDMLDAAEPQARVDLYAGAEQAAKDMATRRMNPTDPEMDRMEKTNQQATEAAPKYEGKPSEDLAEVQKMTQEMEQWHAGEVEAGRLQESEALKATGADFDEDTKASAAYTACLIARGI